MCGVSSGSDPVSEAEQPMAARPVLRFLVVLVGSAVWWRLEVAFRPPGVEEGRLGETELTLRFSSRRDRLRSADPEGPAAAEAAPPCWPAPP